MEPTAAPARVMFRENLAAKVPFWEEVREAAAARQQQAEAGPDDEETPPAWWEPDEIVAARQRLMAVRSHGSAPTLEG